MFFAMLLTSGAKSEPFIEAFDAAPKTINLERIENRANEFGCTQHFSDFYRAKTIEPYIEFFRSRGVQAVRTNINQRHFVSFTMPKIGRQRREATGPWREGDETVTPPKILDV